MHAIDGLERAKDSLLQFNKLFTVGTLFFLLLLFQKMDEQQPEDEPSYWY
jgi:hypothetical protein